MAAFFGIITIIGLIFIFLMYMYIKNENDNNDNNYENDDDLSDDDLTFLGFLEEENLD